MILTYVCMYQRLVYIRTYIPKTMLRGSDATDLVKLLASAACSLILKYLAASDRIAPGAKEDSSAVTYTYATYTH